MLTKLTVKAAEKHIQQHRYTQYRCIHL